jgi:flagellar basal body-associated protein FliL
LVRGSLKKSANDRVLEILSSKIFSRLKKELGEENFMKFAMEKIVGI